MGSAGGLGEDIRESVIISAAPPGTDPPTETVEHACHQIVDAASALTLDLEFIASAAPGDSRRASLDDAHYGIARIVKLVAWIRGCNGKVSLPPGVGIQPFRVAESMGVGRGAIPREDSLQCNICGESRFVSTVYRTGQVRAPALECASCRAIHLEDAVARTEEERESIRKVIALRIAVQNSTSPDGSDPFEVAVAPASGWKAPGGAGHARAPRKTG